MRSASIFGEPDPATRDALAAAVQRRFVAMYGRGGDQGAI
jgi:hypothetical protein